MNFATRLDVTHVLDGQRKAVETDIFRAEARQKGRLIAALKRCATQSPVSLVPVSSAIHKPDALWHTAFMHRLTLGDFELTVFSDGTYPLDGGFFFGVVP